MNIPIEIIKGWKFFKITFNLEINFTFMEMKLKVLKR